MRGHHSLTHALTRSLSRSLARSITSHLPPSHQTANKSAKKDAEESAIRKQAQLDQAYHEWWIESSKLSVKLLNKVGPLPT